jgi:hypothetical protein
MASTGLLGINPYQKGVVFDISSKPINLAIQLEQKQAAKREALDKYYMDYEKSLNPAGMRGQDQNVFLSKLNGAKSYFLQNRDKILNPSKYGAESQSTYLAQLKEAQGIIEQSKQEAANEKADREHYRRAVEQGLDVPDGYLDAVALNNLPLNDPRRVPLDTYRYNFNKPFKQDEFIKDVYGNLKPDKKFIKSRNTPDGRTIDIFETTLSNNDKLAVSNRAVGLYKTDAATKKYVDNIIKTGQYKALDPYYKQIAGPKASIDNGGAEGVAAALALSMNQIGETTEGQPQFRVNPITMINLNKSFQAPVTPMRNLLDDFGSTLPVSIQGGQFKIDKGLAVDKNGRPITGTISDFSGGNLPADIFTVLENYKIDLNPRDKYKLIVDNGQVQGFQTKRGQIIDRNTIEAAQRKYDTERKGEGLYYQNPSPAPSPAPSSKPSGKTKTYKGLDKNGNPIYN